MPRSGRESGLARSDGQRSPKQILSHLCGPEDVAELAAKAGPNARKGTVEEAAEFGEVVLEAIPFGLVHELPSARLLDKIVLSTSNYYPERDGVIDLGGLTQSEYVLRQLPGARLVKAFNMMQAVVMKSLADGHGNPGLAIFIAGDNPEAKCVAATLITDAKFTPIDVGALADGRLFQTEGPLYDTQFSPEEARQALFIKLEAAY